jgi:DNA-binding CsgD family transcriptional regulator
MAHESLIAIHGVNDHNNSEMSCWIGIGIKSDEKTFEWVAIAISPAIHRAFQRCKKIQPLSSEDAAASIKQKQKGEITQAQSRLVCLLRRGLTTEEIAIQLHKSKWTIKTQIAGLHKKYKVRNRVELLQILAEK